MNVQMKILVAAVATSIASVCIAQDELRGAAVPLLQATPAGEEIGLASLEERLKQTKAIPALKKLGLKGEIDNLLAKFRVAHSGGQPDLIALREPYDKLILKIRGMLARDPQLARDIVASKDAIWDRLADRTQFARL